MQLSYSQTHSSFALPGELLEAPSLLVVTQLGSGTVLQWQRYEILFAHPFPEPRGRILGFIIAATRHPPGNNKSRAANQSQLALRCVVPAGPQLPPRHSRLRSTMIPQSQHGQAPKEQVAPAVVSAASSKDICRPGWKRFLPFPTAGRNYEASSKHAGIENKRPI